MSCDVGEAILVLKNEVWRMTLILQPFRRFTYVRVHSTALTFFTYVIGTSCTSPGELPMHRGMKKTVCGGLACYSNLLSLEVATVLDSC